MSGRMPSRLRTEWEQRAGQAAEEVGFGTCRGERKANAAGGLDDTGGDFQETKSQRRELGSGQFPGFGNGVAHGKHQPISGGVENEADLIGERRTAAGAIGGEPSRAWCASISFSPAFRRAEQRESVSRVWLIGSGPTRDAVRTTHVGEPARTAWLNHEQTRRIIFR